METAARELVAEVLVPGDHLGRKTHHEQDRRVGGVAERLVAEGYAPPDIAELLRHGERLYRPATVGSNAMASTPRPSDADAIGTGPDEQAVRALSINTIRGLAMDAVQKANAGHPGTAMALAPLAYVLFKRFLRANPADTQWPDRDRFVLSAGHACILQYSLLHLCGYDLALDDLKQFRQWGSRCPGHPERGHTPGIEVTTGPLGQGVANAVGMALAERFLAERFNRPGRE